MTPAEESALAALRALREMAHDMDLLLELNAALKKQPAL